MSVPPLCQVYEKEEVMGEEVVSQLKVTVSPVPTVSWDGVIVGFCGGSDERRRVYIYIYI